MTQEDPNLEQTPEGSTQETKPEETGFTPIEQRAMEMGWRPKEEFDGEEDDFIDAKEFVRRKPLFDKIEHTTKEVKDLRKALQALKGHYTKVQETEFNRALATLKAQRKEAITNSDGDTFDRLDEEIKRVESAKEVLTQDVEDTPETPTIHPEFAAWKNRNRWYDTEDAMQAYADKIGNRLQSKVAAGEMQPKDVLLEVEKAVRKEFPHKFSNPNKATAPNVANGKESTTRSKADDFEASLTDQERKIMNTLVRSGGLTKEEYLKDLKKIKKQ